MVVHIKAIEQEIPGGAFMLSFSLLNLETVDCLDCIFKTDTCIHHTTRATSFADVFKVAELSFRDDNSQLYRYEATTF